MAPPPAQLSIVVPAGTVAGQTLLVKAPDGTQLQVCPGAWARVTL
jgi:hypothetical protein